LNSFSLSTMPRAKLWLRLARARTVCAEGVVLARASMVTLTLQFLLYALALAGVVAGSLGAIYFAGGAMNPARPAELRRRRGILAALCVGGIVASAAAGFVGIPALLYLASQ